MQHYFLPSAAFVCAAAVVQAATPAETCAALCEALEQEVTLLQRVTDTDSAKSVLSDLRRSMRKQSDLFSADDKELWEYIDNTNGAKLPLVELLQRLAGQFTRLEEVNFYDCPELKEQLYDQVLTDMENAKAE